MASPKASGDPHFDVHPSVLFRLGEELIRDEVQAIAELVKNCYDADSASATVAVDRAFDGIGGRGKIEVTDRGTGMTPDTLRTAFLTLADSPKRRMKEAGLSTDGGRAPLGDKGLGRLGAQRLGHVLVVRTRPGNPGTKVDTEHEITIDWRDVAAAERLSDVSFPIVTRRLRPQALAGTDIVVSGLKNLELFDLDHRRALQNELVRLVSPFGPRRGFHVSVTIDGLALDLYQLTRATLNASVLHYELSFLDGTLTATGRYSTRFFRGGTRPEDRLAVASIAKDRGHDFLEYLNNNRGRTGQFEPLDDGAWFATTTTTRSLAELSPAMTIPPSSQDVGPGATPSGPAIDTVGTNDDPHPPESAPVVADPGNFHAEIYMVLVPDLPDSGQGGVSDAREYLRQAGGVRVYRDGFGINLPRDWMRLQQGATSARSSYGLRPENVLGYVDIGVATNPNLEEATDREAFVASPYVRNFELLFETFVRWTDQVQATMRRQFTRFGVHLLGDEPDQEPDAQEALRNLGSGTRQGNRARKAIDAARANPGIAPGTGVEDALAEAASYFDSIAKNDADIAVVRHELASLREQLTLTYEAVAVGLAAESLVHEIVLIADRLTGETKRARSRTSDASLKDYFNVVDATAKTLIKQASYLSPTLRYRRESQEDLEVGELCHYVASYHHGRLESRGIDVLAVVRNDFKIRTNRGRLTQVLDNLISNSEYWLLDACRTGRQEARPQITLTADSPRILVDDNGPGIDPSIEGSLFDAFVTNKPRERGRGLGLFIATQLLDQNGCSIVLDAERNDDGRMHRFVIDVSPAKTKS